MKRIEMNGFTILILILINKIVNDYCGTQFNCFSIFMLSLSFLKSKEKEISRKSLKPTSQRTSHT